MKIAAGVYPQFQTPIEFPLVSGLQGAVLDHIYVTAPKFDGYYSENDWSEMQQAPVNKSATQETQEKTLMKTSQEEAISSPDVHGLQVMVCTKHEYPSAPNQIDALIAHGMR